MPKASASRRMVRRISYVLQQILRQFPGASVCLSLYEAGDDIPTPATWSAVIVDIEHTDVMSQGLSDWKSLTIDISQPWDAWLGENALNKTDVMVAYCLVGRAVIYCVVMVDDKSSAKTAA